MYLGAEEGLSVVAKTNIEDATVWRRNLLAFGD
jgi:hypothetical protein